MTRKEIKEKILSLKDGDVMSFPSTDPTYVSKIRQVLTKVRQKHVGVYYSRKLGNELLVSKMAANIESSINDLEPGEEIVVEMTPYYVSAMVKKMEGDYTIIPQTKVRRVK